MTCQLDRYADGEDGGPRAVSASLSPSVARIALAAEATARARAPAWSWLGSLSRSWCAATWNNGRHQSGRLAPGAGLRFLHPLGRGSWPGCGIVNQWARAPSRPDALGAEPGVGLTASGAAAARPRERPSSVPALLVSWSRVALLRRWRAAKPPRPQDRHSPQVPRLVWCLPPQPVAVAREHQVGYPRDFDFWYHAERLPGGRSIYG